MFDKLRRDHVELSALSGELRTIVAAPEAQDAALLARLRGRLARIITRHLAIEDALIYAPLSVDPRPEAKAIARRFQLELRHLHGAFETHVLRWTADAVADDWAGHARAMTTLLDALDVRIRCEEDELYPLLAARKPGMRAIS